MDVTRAKQIYEMKDTVPVLLDNEHPVWIENVDEPNKMATVQVGNNPLDTHTVSVERLDEDKKQ
ncbi:H-type small acid-soluble spore protein [Paenibacillus sp. 481]|uniref:H-type small acid-soluble spore protein n=1 Tax=Paenibacillus sp. 481 TaxID=2835869 RepID=UPI001E5C0F5C|nr:H-type small acid-soluble spore protein [Paenibacillus sp. 481]UHA76081.1 H-type small acid-soluble spore protein [Paenibacillus sp. 481]